MSREYNTYLSEHIGNVKRGVEWFIENVEYSKLREILPDLPSVLSSDIFADHDLSKYDSEEYKAYDAYFYGARGVKKKEVGLDIDSDIQEWFDYAWLRHIHMNPHHWQYWVLVNDDKEEGSRALEMPDERILEMICDWWSFSWHKGDLYEVFNWYNEHSDYILLAEHTRKKVEELLRVMSDVLNLKGGRVEDYDGSREVDANDYGAELKEGGEN